MVLIYLYSTTTKNPYRHRSPATMESTRRSIAKALSWRLVATVITSTLVFVITGEGKFAATIGLSDTLIKFFVYFGHERLWNRIAFGRHPKQPEYSI